MTIRLLACDIDDTLVRFPNPPSARVTAALRAATAAGVTVALVTGRSFLRARPVAEWLGLDTPLICNHGGSIRHPDGKPIHVETVPRLLMSEIVDWLYTQDVSMMLFDNQGDEIVVYHDCTPEQVVPDFHPYTDGPGTRFVSDLRAHIPANSETLLAASLDREHLAGVYRQTQARFGGRVRVLLTHPHGMDVLARTATKSRALAWLAEQVGVGREQVMAIGDGVNDVDMLSWAGLGVAMGNAAEEAKAVADVIAPPFEQDGVAWAVEHLILS